MPTMPREVPVLVVGAGPAGLTTALALSRYGVGHLVAERHAGTAHTPRAHIVNQRTVEILRHLGVEDRLHAVATSHELMRDNLWVTSLAGREVARSEAWGTGLARAGEYAVASPAPMANCPQTVFEPLLLDAAREAGSDIRFELEFESATVDEDGVTSTLVDRTTGEQHVVRSRYLLGADGARSKVLATAGLRVEGPAGLAHAVNVWFKADLTRYLAHRPGVLIWNVMPGPLPPLRLGGLICHKPFEEFVLCFMHDPAQRSLEEWSEDELVARVRAAVGDPALDVEVKGVAGWQVNAQVATAYSAGRLLCLGDAVHRHPPTNGLGLNMSVADAFNLAWKLALVLAGHAGPELLDTYSQERQPVGDAGVRRAITSLGELAAVDEALGFTPGQSTEDGWAALELLDAPGPEGDARRLALKEAVALTDRQFNAHGIELGYRYTTGALVADHLPPVPEPPDPVLQYVPTTAPGARVPHARLEQDGHALSTLDLVEGLGFALLTGVGGEAWHTVADDLTTRTGVRVDVHVIGGHRPGDLADPLGEWADRREVGTSGAVLVRPDRHVAWRAPEWSAPAAANLCADFDRILAVSPLHPHQTGDRS
ncbi:FAD-dependent monooxygenase [Amycolatopsis sp. NPDC050768]|uniref:FAD-dependent monooxygenase n=1 Tax=Amycolatopsis sp. NPDC050768 TaxID=3154839 RepID=UPI0033E94A47